MLFTRIVPLLFPSLTTCAVNNNDDNNNYTFWSKALAFITLPVFPFRGRVCVHKGTAERREQEEIERGASIQLKIVSLWRDMIEFPGLGKSPLIIQRCTSVILPNMHCFSRGFK